ncbi:hypothetical protein ACROYT_G039449 [Oculina patagonica]
MAFRSKYYVPIPDNISWPQYVFQNFDKYGDSKAVSDPSTGSFYSFKQLKILTRNFASALVKQGLRKGDVLAIYLPNGIQYPVVYYGALFLGITITTINPQYGVEELAYQLRDAGAKYLITDREHLANAQRAALQVGIVATFTVGKVKGFVSVEELVQDDGSRFPNDANISPKEDVAVLLYSSGTTGLPKGCMLTHYNLIALACIIGHDSFFNLSLHSVVLTVLPLFHGYGQTVMMGMALCKGAELVILRQFEPNIFLQTLEDYKVTVAPVVPPVILFLAKHPMVNDYKLSSLMDVITGGAPVGEELLTALKKRLPHIKYVRQGYGLTECVSGAHVTPLDGNKPNSCGVLLPNLECKVVHQETLVPLGPHEDGEICIRGPTVMKGYLNNPKATAQTIDQEGWVHTGDAGHYDEEGYLYIVDRIKELIKYKGFQVPPAELEALLITHPNIDDVAVIGVPDLKAGELPKAFVVSRGDVTPDDIIKFVAGRVAPHKRLRGGVEFIDQIPKSPSGKILRRHLRNREKESQMRSKL